MKKRIIAGSCIVVMLVSLMGCSGGKASSNSKIDFSVAMNENEESYVFPETETYTNYIKMDKSWGEASSTNGSSSTTSAGEQQFQQEQSAADNSTAIGDPFVMRHNGKYYMYPSTAGNTDSQRGVRVFESDDLINWTCIVYTH
jgi:sucrose-6-phosphate hydrolase SacC (GH32 family)